jgi:[ribosomal protein S18]-alanine N-acetyltransferase
MSAPIVEPLTADGADIEACTAIERASFPTATIDLEAELARGYARVWVARQAPSQPPQGFLLAWLIADELEVLTVATAPDARRRGVGAALVRAALAAASAARCRAVLLEVRRGNTPAIALYRAHGFSAVGLRRRYYQDNDEDALLMTLRLDDQGRPVPGEDDPETRD